MQIKTTPSFHWVIAASQVKTYKAQKHTVSLDLFVLVNTAGTRVNNGTIMSFTKFT